MKKFGILSVTVLFAITVLLAGCGGSGGSAVAPAAPGKVMAKLEFNPQTGQGRIVAQTEQMLDVVSTTKMYQGCTGWKYGSYEFDGQTSVYIQHPETQPTNGIYVYVWVSRNPTSIPSSEGKLPTASEAANPIASTCATVTCVTGGMCTGQFTVNNVLEGSNLVLEAQAMGGEGAYIASLADVVAGAESEVTVTPKSTVATRVAISYAASKSKLLALVTAAEETAINTSVNTNCTGANKYGTLSCSGTVISNGYSLLSDAVINDVLLDAALVTNLQLSSFTPANAATGVEYDSTVFSAVFTKGLATTSASPAGFSAVIQDATTGNSVTITPENYTNYGTLALGGTSNNTLTFTLKPYAELQAASLPVLQPSRTYNVTTFTLPTNITAADGTAWLRATDPLVPTAFSFTTKAYVAPPQPEPTCSGATGFCVDIAGLSGTAGGSAALVVTMANPPTAGLSAGNLTITWDSTKATFGSVALGTSITKQAETSATLGQYKIAFTADAIKVGQTLITLNLNVASGVTGQVAVSWDVAQANSNFTDDNFELLTQSSITFRNAYINIE